ncbi:MAG: DUF368 domain-containing protein [Anaerolineales bacterium]|nr:DUF368 domain-containing protein [Anaerolineales bacterium]
MGMADIVPGVSGGTMAFILGIYDELIESIQAAVPFLKDLFRLRISGAFNCFPWRFLLALGSGIALAILSLASLIHWALEEIPVYIYAIFFGLVLAAVLVVRNRVEHWTPFKFLAMALTTIASYLLVGLTPAQAPEGLWYVFLSGALAICAMILPGISGAFILVLLGLYQFILRALLSFDIVTILVFITGAAFGLLAFSNVLRWLLRHYHDLTVAALIGFMIGALRELWPWKDYLHVAEIPVGDVNVLPVLASVETWLAVGLMGLGFLLVLLIESLAHGKKQTARKEN